MIVNDRDVLLRQAPVRFGTAGTGLVLAGSSPTIRTAADGTSPNPSTVTLTLTLLGVTGTPAWSVTGGTLTGTGDATRTLAASSMTADVATVTATVTYAGVQYVARYSISKVRDGSKGDPGTSIKGDPGPVGTAYATAYLFQWSTVQPALPNAGSTFDWATGVNTAYAGTDAWAITASANPGAPGVKLWVVSKAISAAGGTTQSSVNYSSGAAITAYSQNGAAGAPGIKSAAVRAYQWGSGPAPTIAGTSTYTWASATYNIVPNSWSKTKPTPPGGGFMLYEATVNIVESAGASDSSVDWTTAAVVGISYIGADGKGTAGASAAIAYTLVDGASLAATPTSKQESGRNLPTTGTWGETRAWTAQPAVPAANQSVFQSNGIYDPSTDKTTWNLPYLSNLRVGSLSALAVRTGNLIIDSMATSNGNFSVDVNGSVVARAISIQDASGNVILATGRALADAYVPASAQNSQLQPSIAAAATTSTWTGTSDRPQDISNLVRKSSFEDGSSGGWGSSAQPITGSNAGSVPSKWQLVTNLRDVIEGANSFPVTPSETLYFSVWMGTQDTPYLGRFGLFVYDKDGNIVQFMQAATLSPSQQWTYLEGSGIIVASGVRAVPWLGQDGFDFAGKGYLRATAMWIGRHARGATVGATLGVNVSGTINDSNAAGLVTVSNLRVVSSKIGSYSTAGAGGRTDLNDGGMRVYDGNGALRYRNGNLIN